MYTLRETTHLRTTWNVTTMKMYIIFVLFLFNKIEVVFYLLIIYNKLQPYHLMRFRFLSLCPCVCEWMSVIRLSFWGFLRRVIAKIHTLNIIKMMGEKTTVLHQNIYICIWFPFCFVHGTVAERQFGRCSSIELCKFHIRFGKVKL